MPALTLDQVTATLGSYVEPSGDFTASLNQVVARIYSMGTYRDLTVQYSLPVVDGCVTLPDDADAILHVMVDGYPVPVRSLWHDFRSVGNNTTAADASWGLIDAGYHPTTRLLEGPIETLYIVPSIQGVWPDPFNPDTSGLLYVTATDGDRVYVGSIVDETVVFEEPVTNILSIKYADLAGQFDLRTELVDADTAIATIGAANGSSGSGACRYRRFRINRSVDDETVVHVLCKRAFVPVEYDEDLIYVGNINALKHGLLGRIAEDNADLERSEFHWNKCMQLLEEEASSTRGAAIPRLNIDTGGITPVRQMY
jgi:hypothetical protein